jgi:pimeloyl-ACP methyl ester carboxylesterase
VGSISSRRGGWVPAAEGPSRTDCAAPWAKQPGERFAYPQQIKQPTLIVSGNHAIIVYTVNSLYLVQNLPNAKLILCPDANHGSWYQNHEDFVFEASRFLEA